MANQSPSHSSPLASLDFLSEAVDEAQNDALFRSMIRGAVGVSLAGAILDGALGSHASAITLSVGLLVFVPLIVYFQQRSQRSAARVSYIFFTNYLIFSASLASGHQASSEYYCLAALLMGLLLFKPQQVGLIALSLVVPILSWAMIQFSPPLPLPQQWLSPPLSSPVLKIFNFLGAATTIAIFLGIYIRETTQRRRREVQILTEAVLQARQSALELDSFFGISKNVLAILTETGTFKLVNPAFEKLLCLPTGTATQSPLSQFVVPQDLEKLQRFLDPRQYQGIGSQVELQLVSSDKTLRLVSWSAVFDPQARLFYTIGIDVTEIRDRDREHQQILEAIHEAYVVATTDPEGVIQTVNENFCNVSGYQESELIGSTHALINSGSHSETLFSHLWATIQRGKIWSGEIENRHKSGSPYFLKTVIAPIHDTFGNIKKFISIRQDTTNLHLAQRQLLEAQEVAKIGSWSFNPKTETFSWSSQMYKMHQLPKFSQAPSLVQLLEMTHPDDRESWKRALENCKIQSESSVTRTRRCLGSETVWVEEIAKAIRNPEGGVVEITGTCQDITERARVENQIQQITENSPAVSCQLCLTRKGALTFTYLVPSKVALFDIEADAFFENPDLLLQQIPELDRQQLLQNLNSSAQTNLPFEWTAPFHTPKGRTLWINLQAVPSKLNEHETLWNGFLLDCSAQVKLQQEVELERSKSAHSAKLPRRPLQIPPAVAGSISPRRQGVNLVNLTLFPAQGAVWLL
jgi:PAS domain S-box-containing protein